MVLERFKAIGRGKERKDLEPAERDILRRDIDACQIAREIFLPGIDWNSLTKNQKVNYYKQLRNYLENFPSNLAGRDNTAISIQNALQSRGLLFTHALEGCEFAITMGGRGKKGKLKEIKKQKFIRIPPPQTPPPQTPPPQTPPPQTPPPQTPPPQTPPPQTPPPQTPPPQTPPPPPPTNPVIKGHVYHGHFKDSDHMAFIPHNRNEFDPNYNPAGAYLPGDPDAAHRRGVFKAEVVLWGPYGSWTTTTDEEGHYEFRVNVDPGAYHMLARRGARPDRPANLAGRHIMPDPRDTGNWHWGGAQGGYLPHYIDQVNVPAPARRWNRGLNDYEEIRHPITVDFELTPQERPMRHKISFHGGNAQSRHQVGEIGRRYREIGMERNLLEGRLNMLAAGNVVTPAERQQIERLMDTDYNEAVRRMIEAEVRHDTHGDQSFQLADVRYHERFAGSAHGVLSGLTAGTTRKIGSSAGLLAVGLAFAAITGSWLFTIAFFFWVLSVLFPVPSQYEHVRREIERLNGRYDAIEKSIPPSQAQQATISNIEQRRQTDVMLTWETLRDMNMQNSGVSAAMRYGFRILGIGLFSAAFLFTTIPLAKPIAVVIALVGYFMITYNRPGGNTVFDRIVPQGWRDVMHTRSRNELVQNPHQP